MRKESWSALESGQSTLVHPRCASTATTDMLRTRALLTATTGLVTSRAVFLPAPVRGSTAFMAARASTAALVFPVAATSPAEDMATSDADAIVMTSAAATNAAIAKEETSVVGTNTAVAKGEISVVGTNMAVTMEETSTVAVAFMPEAVPTVAGAGKFHFLAGSERAHTRAK